MRPLVLHASALNDDEYSFYTTSLADLALQPEEEHSEPRDDAYFLALSVGVRETRAWLRGRFSSIPASTVDSVRGRCLRSSLAIHSHRIVCRFSSSSIPT